MRQERLLPPGIVYNELAAFAHSLKLKQATSNMKMDTSTGQRERASDAKYSASSTVW